MEDTTKDISREGKLVELQQLFVNSPDTLYVRGSWVRKEKYTDDIDISAYNKGGGYLTHDRPKDFHGVHISYGGIPSEYLEKFCALSLRTASSLFEIEPLKINDPEIPKIIERAKAYFLTKLPDYILFRIMEEQIDKNAFEDKKNASYEARKRAPGSKRSIQRGVWILKGLEPDLFNIMDSEQVNSELIQRNYITPEIIKTGEEITKILKDPVFDEDRWNQSREVINTWFQDNLLPKVHEYLKTNLDNKYLDTALQTVNPNSSPQEMEEAYRFAQTLKDTRQWNIYYGIASNKNTSIDTLKSLWNRLDNNFVYRGVLISMLENSSFPVDWLKGKDLSWDPLIVDALNKRSK